jgi:ribonuclease HII
MGKYICGIDENGFGSILGPLVVTGILVDEGIKIPEYIKDSKIFYRNRNDFRKLEEIAIVLYYMIEKKLPDSPYEIYKKFTYSQCAFEENICEKNISSNFRTLNLNQLLSKYEDFLKESDKLKKVKLNLMCPYFFNAFVDKKNSKFILNLSLFCKTIKGMEEYDNTKFFCGKIGTTIYYKNYLCYFLPEHEIKTINENDEFSFYKSFKRGKNFEIVFYKNVENISPVSSLASIIGKYIREIIMESIRRCLNIKEEISGYRDKKTKKAIESIDFGKFKKECIIRNC